MKTIVRVITIGVLLATSSLYAASVAVCAGCHGQHFEKAALGKSKIVKEMSFKEIKDSLMGYKNGTYGDTMKALMEAQVKNLSDSEIEAMSLMIKTETGVATEKATEHAAAAAVAAAGGTYRKAGDPITKVVGTDNPIIEFGDYAHYGYTKITAISDNAGDSAVDVTLGYIKKPLE